MSAEIAYALVDNGSNGKKVIAKKDFLPGEVVICEWTSILRFPRSIVDKFKDPAESSYNSATCQATFYMYMQYMQPDQRKKLMSLYLPTTEKYSQEQYKFAKEKVRLNGRRLTTAETNIYVKVARVSEMYLNTADFQTFFMFEHLNRVNHSCFPNCHVQISILDSCVRAIKPIKAGEELTASITPYRDVLPTHLRRNMYLEAKHFTCHCPRCDAPGDDTRQFDCSEPTCKGVMMVCQPINQDELHYDLEYTGVEYVEPHLLPCTVCHRHASPEYETKMLSMESVIAQTTASCELRLCALEDCTDFSFIYIFEKLLEEMQSYVFPKRHLLTVPFLGQLMRMHSMQACYWLALGAKQEALPWLRRTREVALQYIAGQEGALPWPHDTTYEVLEQVCQACIVTWEHSAPLLIFPEEQAQQLLKKTIRMKLVKEGRDDRDVKLEAALVKILQLLPSESALSPAIHTMEVCAFCEESPAHASMKRSRCGACKKVLYCSAGCQKAHWKLHKTVCGV